MIKIIKEGTVNVMKLKKILAILISMIMTVSGFSPLVSAGAESIVYIDSSANQQSASCTVIESTGTALALTDGWYVVKGDVRVSGKITVSGNVNLVLEDLCHLYADSGIELSDDGNTKLTVYGQTEGSGDIVAKGTNNFAGISCSDAVLEINGGNITAYGGKNSAGIGGNYNKAMGTVVVNGGRINATGGQYGAGIGGGSYGNGGVITVNGGIVEATGGLYGSGIGGGNYGKGSDVTVNLGIVVAAGGKNASGIGGGNFGEGGNVTVTGGIVKAVSEIFAETNVHHIGGGIYAGETPGTKNFSGGVVYEGTNLTWYSDTITLRCNLELPAGETFTVEEGKTLEIAEGAYLINNGTFVNNGTLVNKGGFINRGTYTNNGTLQCFQTAVAHPEKASGNAYCAQCNVGDIPFKVDGVYQVGTASELVWLSQNEQSLTDETVRIKLTQNITITDDVGWEAFRFNRPVEFDGNSKTITLNQTNWESYYNDTGLFSKLENSVVKNLVIAGEISHSPNGAIGALAGTISGSRIENVISDVRFNLTKRIGTLSVGGIVGRVAGDGNVIKNCAVYGIMTLAVSSSNVGGIVGEIAGDVTIENCAFNVGEFTIEGRNDAGYVVGVIGDSYNPTIKNVYYYPNGDSVLSTFDVIGSGTGNITQTEEKPTGDFTSGEVAWLLNVGVTDGTQAWYQRCGRDNPRHDKQSSPTVYKGYRSCREGDSILISNSFLYATKPDHTWDNPCDSYCNECNSFRVVEEHSYKNGMCTKCLTGCFEISTADDLLWFSDFVNSGNYTACARLMQNIDLQGKSFTPIASTGLDTADVAGYSGTFTGNGHVIKNINLIVPDESKSMGLFGTVSGRISGVGVENLYFMDTSKYYNLGGIAGQLTESGVIEKCYVANSSLRAAPSAGGIAGLCEGTVRACHSFNLTLGGSLNRFGGICGDWPTGEMTNCYTDFVQLGSTAAGKEGVADSLSEKAVSDDRFESGEIVWLLNSKTTGGIFKQKKESPSYPGFEGYEVASSGGSFKIVYADFEIAAYDSGKKEITVIIPTAGTYSLIVGDYENGELNDLKEFALSVTGDLAGKQKISVEDIFQISEGDHIMLWKNTSDDITPLCKSYKVK